MIYRVVLVFAALLLATVLSFAMYETAQYAGLNAARHDMIERNNKLIGGY